MKTGDVLLVSGKSGQARAIQEFQEIQDKESGKWNHSGLIYVSKFKTYVIEESYIQQRKLRAAVVITPIEVYLEDDCELLLLSHNENCEQQLEEQMFHYTGTPYDYQNLVVDQPILKLFKKWIGKNKDADKRMICHEFSMTVWNNINGWFSDCRKGNVKDLYNSDKFVHQKIK